MFAWFKKLFGKKQGNNGWIPQERLIYEYFDGSGIRKVDPMPLYAKVVERRAVLVSAWTVAKVDSGFSIQAQNDLVNTCREIFTIPKLGPNSEIEYQVGEKTVKTLSDVECITLLDNFLTWTEGVKKNSMTPSETNGTAKPISNGMVGG